MERRGGEVSKSDSSGVAESGGRQIPWIEALRKATQLGCFLLFNAAVFGVGPWPVLLPVLQSLGIPQKAVGGALGGLQQMLYRMVFPWIPLASIILAAVLLGRATCGWACPFGLVQDLLSHVRREHTRVSPRTHQTIVYVKHGVLLVTLLVSGSLAASRALGMGKRYIAALGTFAPAPFNALSPSDTLFAVLPRAMLDMRQGLVRLAETGQGANSGVAAMIASVPTLFWARVVILVGVLTFAAYVPRGWCRYLCPQGGMLALLSRFSFLGLRRDLVKCTRAGCRACVEACPVGVRILDLPWEKFSDPECIYCVKCVEACPTGALRPKFP